MSWSEFWQAIAVLLVIGAVYLFPDVLDWVENKLKRSSDDEPLGTQPVDDGYSTYLFEYYHEGSWWAFTIPARSEDEALERVNKLPHATFLGSVAEEIPARFGWVARLLCWWRNLVT